jgi:hypothetical protein
VCVCVCVCARARVCVCTRALDTQTSVGDCVSGCLCHWSVLIRVRAQCGGGGHYKAGFERNSAHLLHLDQRGADLVYSRLLDAVVRPFPVTLAPTPLPLEWSRIKPMLCSPLPGANVWSHRGQTWTQAQHPGIYVVYFWYVSDWATADGPCFNFDSCVPEQSGRNC